MGRRRRRRRRRREEEEGGAGRLIIALMMVWCYGPGTGGLVRWCAGRQGSSAAL